MGAGVPRGLQNRCEGLEASPVGSIPTCSRHLIMNCHYPATFLVYNNFD